MGQIGLVTLSLLLCVALIVLTRRLAYGRNRITRVLLALVLFWLFVWLSPQLYYGYYLLIFDGLPLQSVIQQPPSPSDIIQRLVFSGQKKLGHHGQGILGWLLVLAALRPQWLTTRL